FVLINEHEYSRRLRIYQLRQFGRVPTRTIEPVVAADVTLQRVAPVSHTTAIPNFGTVRGAMVRTQCRVIAKLHTALNVGRGDFARVTDYPAAGNTACSIATDLIPRVWRHDVVEVSHVGQPAQLKLL